MHYKIGKTVIGTDRQTDRQTGPVKTWQVTSEWHVLGHVTNYYILGPSQKRVKLDISNLEGIPIDVGEYHTAIYPRKGCVLNVT